MDLTSLIAYWGMDETASGPGAVSRADRHTNGLTLSDPLNTTSTTGLVYPQVAQFVAANTNVLFRNDEALLEMGNIDFEVLAWVKLASKPATDMSIVSKGNSPDESYMVTWDHGFDNFRIQAFTGAGQAGPQSAHASTFGSPSLSTWYFLDAVYASGAGQLSISVNNGGFDANGGGGGGAYVENAEFDIGLTSSVGTSWFDGDIGPVLIWKRNLTSAERTFLYNAGAGQTYAAMQSGTLNVVLGDPMIGGHIF